MSNMRIDYLLMALVGGSAMIGWGMRQYRKKQAIDNTPSSKVRSASMGMIELKGLAKPWKSLTAPVSGAECCWWRCKVEKRVSSGKRHHWQTIKIADSILPMYLADETGQVLVDPSGAEVDGIVNTQACNGSEAFFAELGIVAPSGFLGFTPQMRVTEERIPVEAPFYVIGELMHRTEAIEERKKRFHEKIRTVKKDPALMTAADINRDGVVDGEEWDAHRARIEEEFILEEARRSEKEEKLIVRRPRNSETFILSVHEEVSLTTKYLWLAVLLIVGGIAANAYGIFYGLSFGISEKHMGLAWLASFALGFWLSSLIKKNPVESWISRIGVLR